jgi:hypothetical protein
LHARNSTPKKKTQPIGQSTSGAFRRVFTVQHPLWTLCVEQILRHRAEV